MSSSKTFEIKRFEASDIGSDIYTRPDVTSLMRGYRLDTPLEETSQSQLTIQPGREIGKTIFAATLGQKWLGYISVEHFANRNGERPIAIRDDQRIEYLPFLNRLDPALRFAIDPLINRVAYICGISVMEDYKRMGIGSLLMREMVARLNPSIIMAQTKNPALVMTMLSEMSRLRYRTGLTDMEVTSDADPNDKVMAVYSKMYFDAYGGDNDLSWGVRFVEPTELSPYIPDPLVLETLARRFPLVWNIFQMLVMTQERLGKSKTVVMPIFSITEEIHSTTHRYLETK